FGFFFFSSRRRHTSSLRDWSSDVCSSDLVEQRIDRNEPVVADVHMAADREEALGDREIAIAQRALGDRLRRQQRPELAPQRDALDRKSTRLNSSHVEISYAVFCLKKKKKK